MPIRQGYVVGAILQSGKITSGITTDLDAYAFDAWGPGQWEIVGQPGYDTGIRISARAPASAPVIRSGWHVPSWMQDFYYRIHVTPVHLDLGNLLSVQVREVLVWNAYPSRSSTLIANPLDGGDGITVDAPGALPFEFRPLREAVWQISVGTDGPAVINASLGFEFAEGDAAVVTITGARIVPWMYEPHWDAGVTERLAWLTRIMADEELGTEQRIARRLAPRRTFEAQCVAAGQERAHMEIAVYGWGGRPWAMPVWPDEYWLPAPLPAGASFIACPTVGRDFRPGGVALLRGDRVRDYEVVEIEDVMPEGLVLVAETLQAWPVGSRVVPLRTARLMQQPQLSALSADAVLANVQFTLLEPSEWPAWEPPTMYRGHPVLEQPPETSQDLSSTWQRIQYVLDNGTGAPQVTDTADVGFPVRRFSWALAGREERSAHRSLLYYLRGRQKAIWVPTFCPDLVLQATVTPESTTLDVEAVDYGRFGAGKPGRQDIRIELHTGQAFHRRITASTELDHDTERLAIDAPLGQTVTPAMVHRISYMALARSDQDEFEIAHECDGDGLALGSMITRGVRDAA